MSKNRPPPPKPSAIDQALAQYKVDWRPQAPFYQPPADNTRVAARPIPVDRPGEPETFPIRLGEISDRVMELRIRLAGFGGLKPGEAFDDDTLAAVKTFEKDVMGKDSPTGIVDIAIAQRLDQFAVDWPISFSQLKCKCGKCGGFGDGSHKGVYRGKHQGIEAYHDYEYPGIHRALLWGARALMFYCTVDLKDSIRFQQIADGYRCRIENKMKGYHTSNHMGKALDMHFETYSDQEWNRKTLSGDENFASCNEVRKLATTRLNASVRWKNPGRFGLEPGGKDVRNSEAYDWVHLDVREWPKSSLDASYFIKTKEELEGEVMSDLLRKPPPESAAFRW